MVPPDTCSSRSLCLVPMAGFSGFPDGPSTVKVGNVQFTTAGKLRSSWAEFGFTDDPIEKLFESTRDHLAPSDVLAVLEVTLPPRDATDAAVPMTRQALEYLMASNPAWGVSDKRRPVLAGFSGGQLHGFCHAQAASDGGSSTKYTADMRLQEIALNGFWNENASTGFLNELNQLLNGQHTLDKDWKDRLIAASSLLGQARLTDDRWPAFLCGMVGIERLLKRPGHGWSQGVTKHAEALFSWLSNGQGRYYIAELSRLYELRNAVVHEGKIELVALRDARLADEILFNLLLTAMKHTDCITSLDQFLDAAATMQAQMDKGETPSVLLNRAATYPWRY